MRAKLEDKYSKLQNKEKKRRNPLSAKAHKQNRFILKGHMEIERKNKSKSVDDIANYDHSRIAF